MCHHCPGHLASFPDHPTVGLCDTRVFVFCCAVHNTVLPTLRGLTRSSVSPYSSVGWKASVGLTQLKSGVSRAVAFLRPRGTVQSVSLPFPASVGHLCFLAPGCLPPSLVINTASLCPFLLFEFLPGDREKWPTQKMQENFSISRRLRPLHLQSPCAMKGGKVPGPRD